MTHADVTREGYSSPWVVLKFGGTSVSNASNWATITRLVQDCIGEGKRPFVVHSALADVSNMLEPQHTAWDE